MLKLESVSALDAEIERCRAKFPSPRFLLPALIEEVGELAQAIMAGDRKATIKEAIQVACVAMRIAEERDPIEYSTSPTAEAAVRLGEYVRNTIARRTSVAMRHIEHLGNIVDTLFRQKAAQRMTDACFAGRTAEEAKP